MDNETKMNNETKKSMWGEPLTSDLKFCLSVIAIFAAWSFFTVLGLVGMLTK